jgi:hypothetical protein
MALKNDTRIIDGLEVRTSQLPALRSLALSARLGRVAAPALAALGASGGSLKGAGEALIPALTDLCSRLSEGEVESLACDILAATSVVIDDGKGPRVLTLNNRQMIDLAFAGRFKTMLLVIGFALEVNYADFFDTADGEKTSPSAAPGAKSAP